MLFGEGFLDRDHFPAHVSALWLGALAACGSGSGRGGAR